VIDQNAAGHGWFIDPTPYDDAEYSGHGADGALEAAASSPAYGRMDLLSVVMHEIGHLLGFGHDGAASGSVMAGTLEAGERVVSLEASTTAGSATPEPAPPPAPAEPEPAPPPSSPSPGRGRKV
jgi:hypothetical protein